LPTKKTSSSPGRTPPPRRVATEGEGDHVSQPNTQTTPEPPGTHSRPPQRGGGFMVRPPPTMIPTALGPKPTFTPRARLPLGASRIPPKGSGPPLSIR
jgi:hypothetical protein